MQPFDVLFLSNADGYFTGYCGIIVQILPNQKESVITCQKEELKYAESKTNGIGKRTFFNIKK